jgi:hypothetical protein
LSTFEKIPLLEAHDNVDITDFSQLTSVYRLRKEESKQAWAEIESDFVSAGPKPEKEGLAVGVKVAAQSAYPEEQLRDSEAHGGRHGGERLHQLDSAMSRMQEVVDETWETKREVEEANEAREAKKARKAKKKANKANKAKRV